MLQFAKVLTAAVLCWLIVAPVAGNAQDAMRVETVTVTTARGTFKFQTEIADTQSTRERGLMFRKTMLPDRAMLFHWGQPLVASMWMQNTYISLDMLFIAGDGTVRYVAENTKPLSRDIVSAGTMVAGVLEVIAGTAERIGLKPGDKVAHPIFDGS
ncbi:MAG: DUF192 domain-containing protein [Hyphomicrobiales bacterium]|nr:DUF192 domain-containing protein [Hyphomicrobiales bacterium]